jgi:hypothetical protein
MGVLIGFQIITMLSTQELQWLVVPVISYNTVSLIRSYREATKIKAEIA